MAKKLQADEISSIIKDRIENFEIDVDINEVGKVVGVADGITSVYGLNNVMAGEVVEFENGTQGMVLNLEEASVGVVVLGSMTGIVEGMSVKRTGKLLSIPVGDAMLGRVVNPLGEPVDGRVLLKQMSIDFLKIKLQELWRESLFMSHSKQVLKRLMHWCLLDEDKESLLLVTDKQVKLH